MLINDENYSLPAYFSLLVFLFSYLLTRFIPQLSSIGLILSIIPVIIVVFRINAYCKLNHIFVTYVLWNILCSLQLISCYNTYFFRVILFQNIVFLYVIFSSQSIITDNTLKKIIKYGTYIGLLTIPVGYIYNLSFLTLICSYFIFCYLNNKEFALLLLIISFVFTSSRSSILAMLYMYLFYKILKIIKNRINYIIVFFFTIIVSLLIPEIYIYICKSEYAFTLNIETKQITNKNFLSGRNILWPKIKEWIDENNQLIGIGGEFVGGKYAEELEMSTHNLFLFIRGEGGLILLSLLIIFFLQIYLKLYDYLAKDHILIGSAYLLGLIIRATFDLILFANRFIESVMMWFVICLVLSSCNFYNIYWEKNKNV